MTVLEHYKKNLMNSRPFINIVNYPSYLEEYKEKYPSIDFHFLGVLYPTMVLIDTTDFEMDSTNFCDNMVAAVLMENSYKYEKIYSTIILNYDITENYNMRVEETVTDVNGKQVTTMNNGEKVITTQNGEQVTTTDTGESTVENIENVTTYDSTSYNPKNKNSTVESGYITTVNNGAKTDTDTHSSYTDTTTSEEYTNTHHVERYEHGDTSLRPFADVIIKEREIAYMNLLKEIFYDILAECCTYEMG